MSNRVLRGCALPQPKGVVVKHSAKGKCPAHGRISRQTDWLPGPGCDSRMREFRCPVGHAFYEIRDSPEIGGGVLFIERFQW